MSKKQDKQLKDLCAKAKAVTRQYPLSDKQIEAGVPYYTEQVTVQTLSAR